MKKVNNGKITVRLNKYIADAGVCSRREADEFIEAERVIVNGLPAKVGMKISEDDKILVDGEVVKHKIEKPRPITGEGVQPQTRRKIGKVGHKIKSLKEEGKRVPKEEIPTFGKEGFRKKTFGSKEENPERKVSKERHPKGLENDSKKKPLSKSGAGNFGKNSLTDKKRVDRKTDFKKKSVARPQLKKK